MNLEATKVGAWVIHHTNKLDGFTRNPTFEKISDAGRAGKLLAALSATDFNATVAADKVKALAGNVNISRRELSTYLKDLESQRLIETSASGDVHVLAVTTTSILERTHDMLIDLEVSEVEMASIHLSELVTNKPDLQESYIEELSDEFKLTIKDTKDVIELSKQHHFTDFEDSGGQVLLFNGNLFRTGDNSKLGAVLQSLNHEDMRLVNEVESLLETKGCVPKDSIVNILGVSLFNKLHSIGFYDITTVANPSRELQFATLPKAFSKYGNPFTEDGLGHAKQLVSALTYGMNFRRSSTGRIRSVNFLLSKLIRGDRVGPATAIGQDYQILEREGVVRITPVMRGGVRMYTMELLKKDIGTIAQQVLNQGDASQDVALVTQSANSYVGAETNREEIRRLQTSKEHRKSTREILHTLRTR